MNAHDHPIPPRVRLALGASISLAVVGIAASVAVYRELSHMRRELASRPATPWIDMAEDAADPRFACVAFPDRDGRPRVVVFADDTSSGIRVLRADGTQAASMVDWQGSGRMWCAAERSSSAISLDASTRGANVLVSLDDDVRFLATASHDETQMEVFRPGGTEAVTVRASKAASTLRLASRDPACGALISSPDDCGDAAAGAPLLAPR